MIDFLVLFLHSYKNNILNKINFLPTHLKLSLFTTQCLLTTFFCYFTDKKSTPDHSPAQSPFLKSKCPEIQTTTQNGSTNKNNSTEFPDGLAPLAKNEEMSDDLSEETLVNGENPENSGHVISSTPKKSSWRLNGHAHHSLVKSESALEPHWWSDEDEEPQENGSACRSNNSNGACDESTPGKTNNSVHSVEDGFESFSCTDEEDEGDQTSLDSNSTSR